MSSQAYISIVAEATVATISGHLCWSARLRAFCAVFVRSMTRAMRFSLELPVARAADDDATDARGCLPDLQGTRLVNASGRTGSKRIQVASKVLTTESLGKWQFPMCCNLVAGYSACKW
ncbi:hypothetical protein LPJ60_004942 [Coemansia sp. RSA 2675]|nr:hypothetical protein LPJ60_004942 [Coemansia sp. RSA 2675]